MLLKRIEIDNYKSLKSVVLEPTPLATLVGPNAAGKTNFCEALDFLAHVYQWSLEEAVEYKGGYENICFRDNRGASKERIGVRVILEFLVPDALMGRSNLVSDYRMDHAFKFGQNRDRSAAFLIAKEDLEVSRIDGESSDKIFSLRRRFRKAHLDFEDGDREWLGILPDALTRNGAEDGKLVYSKIKYLLPWAAMLSQDMEAVRVFQINSREPRSSGIPTPNPSLGRFGANLPAVMLHLKKNHWKSYSQVITSLRSLLPDLEDLEVEFTHTRSLALFVRQRGQLWPAEDLSDGTVQAIATLTAIFDPRTPLLILEEPENNVHPWALRSFAEAFREASKTKQIILTTHSPILLDQLRPEEIWIVQKPGAFTKIDPLLTLDPSLKDSWERGSFTLSEYLDSGALPEAVPAAAP